MKNYIKQHEAYVIKILDAGKKDVDWKRLGEFHLIQIKFLQHERLVHLIVTVTFGILFFLSIFMLRDTTGMKSIILVVVIFIMLIVYIAHYYILENSVQRWYRIYKRIVMNQSDSL